MFRVGFAYDSHQFEKNNNLILGGVKIESKHGLKGHSDADVLLHALMDALLGSVGSGDLGSHFPDNDPQYKNISSLKLLLQVKNRVDEKNYKINNCDLVVVTEQPKLKSYRKQIVTNIAKHLEIKKEMINFKATTNEKMGFIGREEGMAAYAVVSVVEQKLWQFFKDFGTEGRIKNASKKYNDK